MKEKSVITVEAKEAVRKNIDELKEVLKDDKEFVQELVDKILSLGQGVPVDVGRFIHCGKYSVIRDFRDPQYSKNVDIKNNLSHIWYELGEIMDGKEFYDQEKLKTFTDDEYEEFRVNRCKGTEHDIGFLVTSCPLSNRANFCLEIQALFGCSSIVSLYY